ncbi:uncharacterized protein LOC110857582 isoform X2 [Folsomia candida]|uniref:uncharacterized protein LOC110857582 isoform X2 n=1 Tax=Folsomia candida TaxID=158441 RepID=UPI000B8F304E|nr:uncharacterized protein LOC110857582 isoform X2 [Folsomia candida]
MEGNQSPKKLRDNFHNAELVLKLAKFGDLIEIQDKLRRPHNNNWVLFVRDEFVLHLIEEDFSDKVKFSVDKFTDIFSFSESPCRVNNLGKLATVEKFDLRYPKHPSQRRQMLMSVVKYDKPLWSSVDEEDAERRQSVEDYFCDLNPWGYQHYEEVIKIAMPGDLIEIKRSSGFYRHWTVYVGDGDCIHVGERTIWNYKIVRESLAQICSSQKFQSTCRINNLQEWAERKGVKAREGCDVVAIAESFLGQMFDFEIYKNNCEHFATLCRFGDPVSRQVDRKTELFDVIVFDLIELHNAKPAITKTEIVQFSEEPVDKRRRLN